MGAVWKFGGYRRINDEERLKFDVICACGHALADHLPRVSSDCIECDVCGSDERCLPVGMTTVETDATELAETMQELFTRIKDDIYLLGAYFTALTDWTNSQGDVTGSSTLYKMRADIDYLLDVAPRILKGIKEWT